MVKSAFSILAVAAIGGIALTPVAASAATAEPAVLAHSSSPAAADPNTTVTVGALSLTAPASVDLGSGAPGTTISSPLGGATPGDSVLVTDNRALLSASWISPQDIVNATNVDGNTTVTWNPVIDVAIPGGATGGTYTATIVHSVT
jgi:hypothetical protein